jgi:hypothetical protein
MSKRLRMLMYADYGVGKTRLAVAFPRPYIIDMEDGTEWYRSEFDLFAEKDYMVEDDKGNKVYQPPEKPIEEFSGYVDLSITPEGVEKAVRKLLTTKHNYSTLVIDPITVYWSALQKKWSDIFLLRNKGGKGYRHEYYDIQQRDWGTINSEVSELMRLLTMLDMNVVVMAVEKEKQDKNMNTVGMTLDGPKRFEGWASVVLRAEKRGDNRIVSVKKDRTGRLPEGEFPLDYSVFQKAYSDIIGMNATPIKMITDDQAAEIIELCTLFEIANEDFARGIAKYGASEMDDLTEAQAGQVLDRLRAKGSKKQKEAS